MPNEIERKTPKYLILGEILRPHGVRGEVRMRIITDYPERLLELKTVYLGKSTNDKRMESIKLDKVRFHKEYALLTLKGYNDRTQADALRKKMVMIDFSNAVPLDDGQYYLFQLIGMMVVSEDEPVGIVKEVLQTGANDVYIVDSEKHGEVLIPAHSETIVKIDFESETITMKLPEGLLPSS